MSVLIVVFLDIIKYLPITAYTDVYIYCKFLYIYNVLKYMF